jgi:integrase
VLSLPNRYPKGEIMGKRPTKLTDKAIDNLRPDPTKRYEEPDVAGAGGLCVVVHPSGRKTFAVRFRFNGEQRKPILGAYPSLTLAAARSLASDMLHDVAKGIDPSAVKAEAKAKASTTAENTLRKVCEKYQARVGKSLRTAARRAHELERLVYPTLGDRPITSIKRSEIANLLDKIEDDSGQRTADHTLSALRTIMTWYGQRDDDFTPPIIKGMGRYKNDEHKRERTLTEDELRKVWRAAGDAGEFGALVKFLLLTAARRNEAARMLWSEIDDETWTLPASRHKIKTQSLSRPLSQAAIDLLQERPRIDRCKYVFTNDGRVPVSGFADLKRAFDKKCGVTGWTIHDLRRTARTLMARVKVPENHAERCLGHAKGGMVGVYDQHQYQDEMLQAYEALAREIRRIVDPPKSNIRQLRRRG